MDNRQRLDTVVRESIRATCGDLSALDACLTEDVCLISPLGEYRGRDAVAEHLEEWFGFMTDLSYEVHRYFADGQDLFMQWTFRATLTGSVPAPFTGAVGDEFRLEGASLAELSSSGLISRQRDYFDTPVVRSAGDDAR